jgi:hypothetical protein
MTVLTRSKDSFSNLSNHKLGIQNRMRRILPALDPYSGFFSRKSDFLRRISIIEAKKVQPPQEA